VSGSEVRSEFHRELEKLDISLAALLALVPDAIRTATTALLGGDEAVAARLEHWPQLVNDLYADVEQTCEAVVARQAPVARDLRFLFACIRLVPGLHDAVDLVADIASTATRGVEARLTPRLHALTEHLGHVTAETWVALAALWAERDTLHLEAVRARDDDLAEARSVLVAEVASGVVDVPIAMELALLARAYERLGRVATSAATIIGPLIALPRP
jgi:phosphate transport system protein